MWRAATNRTGDLFEPYITPLIQDNTAMSFARDIVRVCPPPSLSFSPRVMPRRIPTYMPGSVTTTAASSRWAVLWRVTIAPTGE